MALFHKIIFFDNEYTFFFYEKILTIGKYIHITFI